jgi:DNA-binding NarL/FixJ family response regulator
LLKPWADSNGLRVVEVDPHGTLLESRPGASDHPYKLILLVIGAAGVGDPEPQNWITSLSGAYAHVPLVLVSDREDAKEVLAALEAGVSGFIPTSIALPVAMQALTFIVGGGSFFPPAALTEAARSDHSLQTSSRRGVTVVATASMDYSGLTARQQEVLEHLRQGESNKLIGRHLKLRESTVKVHIRHIMRKLGAINRTQAALSAVHLQVSTIGTEVPDNAEHGDDDDEEDAKLAPSRTGGGVLASAGAGLATHTKLLPSEGRGPRLIMKSGLRPTSK